MWTPRFPLPAQLLVVTLIALTSLSACPKDKPTGKDKPAGKDRPAGKDEPASKGGKLTRAEAEELARSFFAKMRKGEHAKARAMGTDKLAKALPPATLDAMWNKLQLQVGAFQRIVKAEAKAIQGGFSFRFRCAFAKAPLYVIISVSPERKIQGLFFRPAKKAKRPQTPKPPFPYASHEVSFINAADKTQHGGTLTVPKGKGGKGQAPAGPFPAAVLITGSGSQDRDETIFEHKPFWVIADHLTRAGVAVLRVDDRGVGKSGGDPREATIQIHATDVMAAMDFLKTRKEIDAKKIGVIGHSEGGVISALVGAQREDLAFIVSLAGTGIPGAEITALQAVAMAKAIPGVTADKLEKLRKIQQAVMKVATTTTDDGKLEAALKRAFIDSQRLGLTPGPKLDAPQIAAKAKAEAKKLSAPWSQSFFKLDPAVYWAKVKCPVLALNGKKDTQVDAEVNLAKIEAALKKGGNKQVTIKALEGLNHLFQPAKTGQVDEYAQIETTIQPAVLELMASWIRQHVGSSGPE